MYCWHRFICFKRVVGTVEFHGKSWKDFSELCTIGRKKDGGGSSVCVCVYVFPDSLLFFFKKKHLNTKECVKGTNVRAPGPLDDCKGVKGQNMFSTIVSVQALTRWDKSPSSLGILAEQGAGSFLPLNCFITSIPTAAHSRIAECASCVVFVNAIIAASRWGRCCPSAWTRHSQVVGVSDKQVGA